MLMLIGIDASRYCHPMPTGVEVYSDHIIDGLLSIAEKQKKHRLLLYTPTRFPHLPKKLQRILPHRRLWTQRHLTREMRQNPPDVLFVPSHVLPRKHPRRTIITIHDVAFREFPDAYSLFQYAYLNWSTKYAVKHSWRIVVPSTGVRDDLIRLYKAKAEQIVVIPHGFQAQKCKISPTQEKKILKKFHLRKNDPYVFFVGRLETKKNLSRLIQAFSKFHTKHPEWRLILGGGRGVGFRSILRALEKENVLQDVILPGYLTEEEKCVLLSRARLFAFPSLAEGFGFPILEAASYGVPILGSRIPALLDFDELIDVFVDPKSVDDIARGLSKLANAGHKLPTTGHKLARSHAELSHAPGGGSYPRKGGRSVSSYSWSRSSRKVWDLLTSDMT